MLDYIQSITQNQISLIVGLQTITNQKLCNSMDAKHNEDGIVPKL